MNDYIKILVKKAEKKNQHKGWQEEKEQENRDLFHLHSQSLEASSSRNRNFKESNVNHEFFYQWHFWQNWNRSRKIEQIQQKSNSLKQRNSNSCEIIASWRIGKTCSFRRDKSCHKIHFINLNWKKFKKITGVFQHHSF